jgi:ATP synthase protein I
VATFIGLFIGLYMDKLFDTSPWLMIIFLIFGIAAGFKNLFVQAKKYGLMDDDDEQ